MSASSTQAVGVLRGSSQASHPSVGLIPPPARLPTLPDRPAVPSLRSTTSPASAPDRLENKSMRFGLNASFFKT